MALTYIIRIIWEWRRERSLRQFVKFGIIGLANTFLDFGVYVSLTRLFDFWETHFLVANAVSFTIAAASSFVLNTFWTFRAGHGGWQRRFPRFFIVAAIGMLLSSVILGGLTALGVHDVLAKVVATAIVMAWNFTVQKTWTFKI